MLFAKFVCNEVEMENEKSKKEILKGRGAQFNPANPYLANEYVEEHIEGLDEPMLVKEQTELLPEFPKKIVNKVTSPDIPLPYSMNPYQGCEHGCVYCYARETHQYWGLSAGLDFERKIIVKENAPELLAATFDKPGWKPQPIMLSGNTDCYQPVEREKQLTRRMLEVLLEYRNPVGIITKNSLVLRDLDIIREMAQLGLVKVAISVTTMDEDLRRQLEPRTSTGAMRMRALGTLAAAGVPTSIMVAPVIPGLNSHEINSLIRHAASRGVLGAGFTLVRLNGTVADLFVDWIYKAFPDRAEKVLRQVAEIHGGKLGERAFGKRMRGQGTFAEAIRRMFKMAVQQYMGARKSPPYNLDAFRRPRKDGQLSLFG